jgi:heat shock 70kDa protein 4
LENKKIGFEVVVRGEKKVFTPEQVMGYYLKKVKTYFEKAGMMSKEIVISVPTYATNSERQAYLDAAEIAGIKCIRLINESTATALTYGFFRKADLDDKKERVVAFVDFGHSKLSITYAAFVKTKMRVISTHSNRNLGARQIDYQLFDLLGGEFAKKFGCDPRPNIRCRLRLLDSIEKMRKLLTSNKESDVTCEALLEDEDLKRHFTREQLEKLMEPFMVDFRKCLEDSLAKSGKLSLKLRTHEW